MKPMVLSDVAEAIGMHESTVSRVTTRKYMHTPRGIFELKYFFSSHVHTTSGSEASSTAIRAVLRKLIEAENPCKAPQRPQAGGNALRPGDSNRAAHRREVPRGDGNSLPRPSAVRSDAISLGFRPGYDIDENGAVAPARQYTCEEPSMQINLTGHHVDVTPELRKYVSTRSSRGSADTSRTSRTSA